MKKLSMTVDDIKRHCRVESNGCWTWLGETKEIDRIVKPRPSFFNGKGPIDPQTLALAHALLDSPQPTKIDWATPVKQTCGNRLCCQPQHQAIDVEAIDQRKAAKREHAARLLAQAPPAPYGEWAPSDTRLVITQEVVDEFAYLVAIRKMPIQEALQKIGTTRGVMERAVSVYCGQAYWNDLVRKETI